MRDGFVELSLQPETGAETIVGFGGIGHQPDSLLQMANGLAQLSARHQQFSEVVVGSGKAWLIADGLSKLSDSCVDTAERCERKAKVVVWARGRRIEPHGGTEVIHRFVGAALF